MQRDAQIISLQDELERLSKAYDGVVMNFKEKMTKHKIPEAELGFRLASARDILLQS